MGNFVGEGYAFTVADYDSSANGCLDSGASHHMTGDLSMLKNTKASITMPITIANGSRHIASMTGVATLRVENQMRSGEIVNVPIEGVLYVRGLKKNLISVRQLASQGINVTLDKNGGECLAESGELLFKCSVHNGIYYIDECEKEMCAKANLVMQAKDSIDGWHERMCHVNHSDVAKLYAQRMCKSHSHGNRKVALPAQLEK